MNHTPENETEAIRSEIDSTRRRMDDTMDEIGDRLQGRHLIDEILGFFRNENGKVAEVRDKLTRSAQSATHAVVDSVRANPVPALLIGAGVAWLIYERRRKPSFDDYEAGYEEAGAAYENMENQPDIESLYDRPLDYPSSATVQSPSEESGYSTGATATPADFPGEEGSKLGRVGEKAAQAGRQVKETLSNAGAQLRERSHQMGDQARQLGSRVQERARDTYQRSRERVVTTANEHPLELGLACLAAGVIAGLSLPTPERLNRLAGPTVDRLRDRTRQAGSELLQKGQRVASAAASAVKEEAQAQGLTPDKLKGSAQAVADRAKEAAAETARKEGITPGNLSGSSGPKTDPLASRPVM